MKNKMLCNHTKEKLISEGYKIQNAKIIRTMLSTSLGGYLVSNLWIENNDIKGCFGDFVHGHIDLDIGDYKEYPNGAEIIVRIMDVVGVGKWESLEGQAIRIATKGDNIGFIGNIVDDRWLG